MRLRVEISQVRPISNLVFEIELGAAKLYCIAGKNGTGKTTLAKALLTLVFGDTFARTSSEGVFNRDSKIRYTIDGLEYVLAYDSAFRSLNSRRPIPTHIKDQIAVELPAPHGERFTFFRALANSDRDIRRQIVLRGYTRPRELVEFLSNVYGERRFDELVEVRFSEGVCCCFVQPDSRYVREDYFSSGEYFLISLYRKVRSGKSLVMIDEIDISLDATAQANLARELRALCDTHNVTVVFTSHSLALMQTLEADELLYLERTEQTSSITPMSFNSIKTLMFGFKGWDRYILTEDECLEQFLVHFINRYCNPTFHTFQIIRIGGGFQVTDLMRRNRATQFLGREEHVISVLDGDQTRDDLPRGAYCIPVKNVEKALWDAYREQGFAFTFADGETLAPKQLYKAMVREGICSQAEIFELICDLHNTNMQVFANVLKQFLCRPANRQRVSAVS
jgi:ABC-type multidrug transport system ATPase subunit